MKPLERPPVWMMRQTGRYYQNSELCGEYRFFHTLQKLKLAAEITVKL
jgi:uroporphyrinogen-III decarboxylase